MSIAASLIGCGRMGCCHAQALKKLNANLLSIADLRLESTKELIKIWGSEISPNVETSLDALLLKGIPDLLIISTTAQDHGKAALEAVKAGVKYILIEKPVATSLSECSNLLKAISGTKTRIAVNHQMRFLPQYLTPKKLLTSSAYGGFKSMHVTAGNFGMAMNSTHYIEAFRFLADEKPDKVSAWFDDEILPNPRGTQFQDVSGCIRVTTASGRRLYIDASANQGHGVQVTYMGRNGRITIDELAGTMTTVIRKPEHRELPTSRYGMPVDIETHKIKPVELIDSTKAVLEALIENQDYPTLHEATSAVKTLIAAYHSHRKGGIPVSLADIPDDNPEVFPWA